MDKRIYKWTGKITKCSINNINNWFLPNIVAKVGIDRLANVVRLDFRSLLTNIDYQIDPQKDIFNSFMSTNKVNFLK